MKFVGQHLKTNCIEQSLNIIDHKFKVMMYYIELSWNQTAVNQSVRHKSPDSVCVLQTNFIYEGHRDATI